jgi:serine/threonine protein kinase
MFRDGWTQWYLYYGILTITSVTGEKRQQRPVFIKYAHYYCEEAHVLLAQNGLAPIIHVASTTMDGDYRLIVMDRIVDCETLDQWCGRKGYVKRQQTSQVRLKEDRQYQFIMKRVEDAVRILHENGFVFGDLRANNIIVKESQPKQQQLQQEHGEGISIDVYLIDFDWAGKENQDVYHTVPNDRIRWHEDVHPNNVLKKDHDLLWLRRLQNGDWWSTYPQQPYVPSDPVEPEIRRSQRNVGTASKDSDGRRPRASSSSGAGPAKKPKLG